MTAENIPPFAKPEASFASKRTRKCRDQRLLFSFCKQSSSGVEGLARITGKKK